MNELGFHLRHGGTDLGKAVIRLRCQHMRTIPVVDVKLITYLPEIQRILGFAIDNRYEKPDRILDDLTGCPAPEIMRDCSLYGIFCIMVIPKYPVCHTPEILTLGVQQLVEFS